MAGSTALIARKSIRARLGRTIVIALAITASVSFVVGSFVLADSLQRTFDDLFAELNEEIDLSVRSAQEFEGDAERDPIDPSIAGQIESIDGVDVVEPTLFRYAQLIDADGDAIAPPGSPTFGVSYIGDSGLQGVTVKSGEPPTGPDQLAIDQASADRDGFELGDTVEYLTDTGRYSGTISAFIGLGEADSFGGAQLVALDLDTALERLTSDGTVDSIEVQLDDGADVEALQTEIAAVVPDGFEVVPGEQVAEEDSEGVGEFIGLFGTGLLVFAFVTAFVSAFIINNIFQITIGQRLRELALLRAVGASGRQVRRMITVEAFALGLVSTVLGIGGGILVARLLIAGFNAAGAGFPSTATVLAPRTFVAAALVGIGITMLSVIVPARRAANIPPVAAMRPELGFQALRARRLVLGAVLTVVGAALFLLGLFTAVGGTTGLIAFGGGGALLLFLGVSSLSATIATPVTKMIGWPVEKIFKTPGALARQNVARAPRRTSSSAAALMIGVALVSAAAVFASSLRATFVDTLENAITADYVITDQTGFQGISPVVAESLADLPEVQAVTPVRGIGAIVDGDEKSFGAIDADAFEQLVDPDLQEGSIAGLGLDEILIHEDPADDLDAEVGTVLDVTYQNGTTGELTVAGIYGDSTFGNWLIGLDTLESVSNSPARDFFVIAQMGADVSDDAAIAAMEMFGDEFPQANIQTTSEFRETQEAQINQLLIIISMLLLLAVIIAIIGISITLALGVFERTREIGLLRAVGMNRKQTRRSVRWEAVIVSTFGAIVGIVLGTFLGVVLSLAVPEDIIDQLAFSPVITVAILVGAVIAGLAAAVYPSYKASRMDVLEAIATE
jgi:putative ABC transport system permease protein